MEAHERRFGGAAERYRALRADVAAIDRVRRDGCERARSTAVDQLAAVRAAVDLRPVGT